MRLAGSGSFNLRWLILFVLILTIMQQSTALKILHTRLKTVPTYSFNSEQFEQSRAGNTSSGVNSREKGSKVLNDEVVNEDSHNIHNVMDYSSNLQQFKHIQLQHRLHSNAPTQSPNSSNSSWSTKEHQIEEHDRALPVTADINRHPSKSSRQPSEQLHL